MIGGLGEEKLTICPFFWWQGTQIALVIKGTLPREVIKSKKGMINIHTERYFLWRSGCLEMGDGQEAAQRKNGKT